MNMNTITSGIKSWKTTLIGIALAILTIMQDTRDLSDWQTWVFPALIAALGILSRDANKTSESSGITPLILGFVAVSAFVFVSCAPQNYIVNTKPYTKQIESDPENVVVAPEHVEPVGGFQANIGGTLVTDYGEITVDKGGVSTDLVVDTRSGK